LCFTISTYVEIAFGGIPDLLLPPKFLEMCGGGWVGAARKVEMHLLAEEFKYKYKAVLLPG
jgi:hypothetical protein